MDLHLLSWVYLPLALLTTRDAFSSPTGSATPSKITQKCKINSTNAPRPVVCSRCTHGRQISLLIYTLPHPFNPHFISTDEQGCGLVEAVPSWFLLSSPSERTADKTALENHKNQVKIRRYLFERPATGVFIHSTTIPALPMGAKMAQKRHLLQPKL